MSNAGPDARGTPVELRRPKAKPLSIWIFITAEVLTFTLFFALFMNERIAQTRLFNESARSLDSRFGLINALILLTSSLAVVFAVESAKRGEFGKARPFLAGAMTVGGGFAITKCIEWTREVSQGVTPQTNDFFMFYFALTGIHFLHFLAGMCVLAVMYRKCARPSVGAAAVWIESGGLYWHMVDILWIILFPMVYLLGAV